jgi:hypothetical protein
MNTIMKNFQNKYPTMVGYLLETVDKYPAKTQMGMVINVSILMAEMYNGSFDTYLQKGKKMNAELVDMFARTYLQNYCKLLDTVYMCMGNYDNIPKLNKLDPRKFIHNLIQQTQDEEHRKIVDLPETRQLLFNIIDSSVRLSNVKYVLSVKYPELLPFITDEVIEHNAAMYHLAKKLSRTDFHKKACIKKKNSKTYKKGCGEFHIDLSKSWE